MKLHQQLNPESVKIGLSDEFYIVNGRKGPKDFILFFRDHPIKFLELAQAVAFLHENEERIWPKDKGFKGGDYLRKLLNECMDRGSVTLDMLDRYHLK